MRGSIPVPLLDGPAGARGEPLAWVRPLTGAEEALLDSHSDALPAELATAIIAAATERIGDCSPVSPALARDLSVGDRERLLVACAAATLGDPVDIVARCPDPGCGESIELSIVLRDLLRPSGEDRRTGDYELALDTEAGPRTLRFRLPTGGDQEEAARRAALDPDSAAAFLVERCLIAIRDEHGRDVSDSLDGEVARALDEAIERLDPAAETVAEGACPACGGTVRTLLDGFTLLRSGVASGDRLFLEIDSLARTYHWNETEILSLPLPRRRRYLDLILAGAGS